MLCRRRINPIGVEAKNVPIPKVGIDRSHAQSVGQKFSRPGRTYELSASLLR